MQVSFIVAYMLYTPPFMYVKELMHVADVAFEGIFGVCT